MIWYEPRDVETNINKKEHQQNVNLFLVCNYIYILCFYVSLISVWIYIIDYKLNDFFLYNSYPFLFIDKQNQWNNKWMNKIKSVGQQDAAGSSVQGADLY